MYGQPPRFHGGGFRGTAQPSQPSAPPSLLPNYFLAPNFFLPNANLLAPHNQFVQNPNFPFQNPNVGIQNAKLPVQNPIFHSHQGFQHQPPRPDEVLDRIDRAVVKARGELIASGQSVSAWKVSQTVLLSLQANSWESLGFQIQQVPSLNRLIITEGKINTFIHCFVAVRRITTLYDLEVAICKSEGIEKFEELDLGPLVSHPFVVHYFPVGSDSTEVLRITSEEIISCLCEFINNHNKGKKVGVEEFLDFIASKRSVTGREKLGVHIQSLRTHISHIKKAKNSEDRVLSNCIEGLKMKPDKKNKKRPLFSSQKKQMDEHFDVISQRVKSFSSTNGTFCGKHTRFLSSSSEDDDSDNCKFEESKYENEARSPHKFSMQSSSDRVSSCPYPSATEEMTRLGMKSEMDGGPRPASSRYCDNNASSRRKRKPENISCTSNLPHKLPKKENLEGDSFSDRINQHEANLSLTDHSIKMFIATWKEACQENDLAEVFERMLQFYKTRKKEKVKTLFSSFPFAGLLNLAVNSIKCGMWDSMYDTFQTFTQQAKVDSVNTNVEKYADCLSIEVELSEKEALRATEHDSKNGSDVTVDDILKKVFTYFEFDCNIVDSANVPAEKKFMFLVKLCKCQSWLAEQFHVGEFETLGYGEFFMFLEKYVHVLPRALQSCLVGETYEKFYLEACIHQNQLATFLSQASSSLLDKERLNKQKIYELLTGQFPSMCFKLIDNGHVEDFWDLLREKDVASPSVIFSAPLVGKNYMGDPLSCNEKGLVGTTKFIMEIGHEPDALYSLTINDAMMALHNAPMLTDLDLWLHWDIKYASSLGSLVSWLLNELNSKELLCMVTKSGKVIRIDPSATPDSFLEAFLQGSSFLTAVKLLSLIALYGGERSVPLSLLKYHSHKAFEVFSNNSFKIGISGPSFMQGEPLHGLHMFGENSSRNFSSDMQDKGISTNDEWVHGSNFILDCLGYLPSEFRSFAADILLSGFRRVVKEAPVAILSACKQTEQRVMLHEVGLVLGIVEWVNDYNKFCCLAATESGSSSLVDAICEGTPKEHPLFEMVLPVEANESDKECKEACSSVNDAEVSCDSFVDNHIQHTSELDQDKDAAKVIESIRREEFGFDPTISVIESSMLKKQHARLGRALHCLSQELYSHDSHFLLELVQNADDNAYPRNVEPSLIFILGEEGIVVLNNEQGFSAENIRALCDVGNSTKKGSTAGYIGKKGIGFKSVFRVTDTPEIHSNGFHIKFDITKGQIGFILPTTVPPCDVDYFIRQVSMDTSEVQNNSRWNTCIILPFRTKSKPGFAMNNIISMFSDLHPSLLLFLHRLECIKFRNMLKDSLVIMRKEVLGDGIIKVSLGREKMTWLVVSQKLDSTGIRPDAQMTEISIAFTLQELGNGDYIPSLDQQPVFAFLPLRTYGLKFIVQGDFVLPSSREEVDGDSPWNQWLLSEFPVLFVNAEKSFCSLPCFRGNPGKAISAFMSFVPLPGEVHGFFSGLSRLIISKLRTSNCVLVEGDGNVRAPPCKVLRNWTEQARTLLPDCLLHEHLGLGYLSREIVISDSLARALCIEEYGPKILLQIISSLCRTENSLKTLGLDWLFSWINAIYVMTSHTVGQTSLNFGNESDTIIDLKKIPFIPLSDGKYGSVDEGAIWLHVDASSIGSDNEYAPAAFPKLYSRLRMVSPCLFSVATASATSCSDVSLVENVTRMLHRIGVQQLSAHEIIKVHILPAISDVRTAGDKELMTEYLSFVMFHLQLHGQSCWIEKRKFTSELCNKAFILTNHGYKRPIDVPIHLSKEFGNPIDLSNLLDGVDVKWHEVDSTYLKHPVTTLISDGALKWRNFFHELGITDFVQVVPIKKSVVDASDVVRKNLVCDRSMISPGSFISDWESEELVQLLSQLSSESGLERCKNLLGILDTLWDDCFSDKVTGHCIISSGECIPFKSSLMSILHDIQWAVSSIDDELHCPKDLFHDCESVRSILGSTAPYAVPKVRSQQFLKDIGFKTVITVDDALSVLRVWRRVGMPFKASIWQMSRFYTFIWNEMVASRQKVVKELFAGAFIFVPCSSVFSRQDAVPGVLMSAQDVFWHDSLDLMEQMKVIHPDFGQDATHRPLCNIYPGFQDFFVNVCGVDETPPLCSYLQFLLQLSKFSLPSQAGRMVFQVFVKWTDGLKSGLLSSEGFAFLEECLLNIEYAVLPTALDKWVSLHPSFGLLCWCDDEHLGREFRHFQNIDFLYFGQLNDDEQEVLSSKVSILLKRFGIRALSEVVTRDAIYYGLGNNNFKASLMNWALPYAQRYIYNTHLEEYLNLKQSGFANLERLRIVVTENLFYRNVIKESGIISKKRYECSCLLQGDVLYTTQESDFHSLFMELSRLLFDGNPELQFANFLHMITTMAESGSSEENIELFILNRQRVPKLPDGEPVWSLSSSATEYGSALLRDGFQSRIGEPVPVESRKYFSINSIWPPANWKTAPRSCFPHANGFESQAGCSQQMQDKDSEEIEQTKQIGPVEIIANWIIEDNQTGTSSAINLPNSETSDDNPFRPKNAVTSGMNVAFDHVDLVTSGGSSTVPVTGSEREQLSFGTVNPQLALLTGRIGEFVAYRYFVENAGDKSVTWVNEMNETGLPYDIVVGDSNCEEYVEVKATKSGRKDWFEMSVREWQFAMEKRQSFSIAHVVLLGNNMTRIAVYKHPARLCQQGKLKLAVVIPKQ